MHWRNGLIGLIIVLGFISGLPVNAASEAAPTALTAFAALPGFPRTEPQGSFYSSPSVFDLNNDGQLEVVVGDSAGCVWAFNRTGQKLAGFPWKTNGVDCNGGLRINNSLAIGDIDGDNLPEIIAGTRGRSNNDGERGKVWAWNPNGSVVPGWPQGMEWSWQQTPGNIAEYYSVAVANVIGNRYLEVIGGTSNDGGNGRNLYVWNGNGSVLSGYPTGYNSTDSAGIFGHVGAGDINGDGLSEVVTGRDHIYAHVYNNQGQFMAGWPVLTYLDATKTTWGQDKYVEFTRSAPVVADLDNDGSVEIAIAGKVRDPLAGGNHPQTSSALMVFNSNGQRRAGWNVGKTTGGPLASDFVPNAPVTPVDLDGDGTLELVVTYDDGTIRAYNHSGTQLWSYNYAQGRRLLASEVVVGDITGDGTAELVFGLYAIDSSAFGAVGIMALNEDSRPESGYPILLNGEGNASARGIMAAPTLTDLNADCRLDIVAHSRAGTLYAWNTGGFYLPQLLTWPTSRGDNTRRGTYVRPKAPGGSPWSPPRFNNNLYLPLVGNACRP